METEPLTSRVGESLGANIYYARLRGHGRGSAAMSEASAGEWLADTREAFDIGRRLGERRCRHWRFDRRNAGGVAGAAKRTPMHCTDL